MGTSCEDEWFFCNGSSYVEKQDSFAIAADAAKSAAEQQTGIIIGIIAAVVGVALIATISAVAMKAKAKKERLSVAPSPDNNVIMGHTPNNSVLEEMDNEFNQFDD